MQTSLSSYIVLLALSLVALPLAGCDCEDAPEPEPETEEPTPEPTYNRGFYLDMTLDGSDNIWLAYQNAETTSLEVARGSGDPIDWQRWTVDGEGEVISGLLTGNFDAGNYASIAVDGGGMTHVVHWDKEDDRLLWAMYDGSEWTKFTAADSGGQFASLGIRNEAEPIVAYYDGGKLKVATRANGAWTSETVDDGAAASEEEGDADVGKYADLVVASDGSTYIAYHDATNGDLKVARGYPGNWDIQVWASEGNVGQWPALSERNGDIYVSYHDVDAGNLMFGHWMGTALEAAVVDSGDFVGADSAHAWFGDTAVIVYHDGVNNDAKLAVAGEDGWEVSTHMAQGAVGFYNSLALSASGELVWSGFNHTTTDIVVQRFSP